RPHHHPGDATNPPRGSQSYYQRWPTSQTGYCGKASATSLGPHAHRMVTITAIGPDILSFVIVKTCTSAQTVSKPPLSLCHLLTVTSGLAQALITEAYIISVGQLKEI